MVNGIHVACTVSSPSSELFVEMLVEFQKTGNVVAAEGTNLKF